MKLMPQMLLAVALSACGASGSKGLSVSAKGSAATAAASPTATSAAALSGSTGAGAGSAPKIERVRLVISDLELGATTAFDGRSASLRIVPGPVVVDLDAAALASSVRKVIDVPDVGPGEYAYARFRVRPLDSSEASLARDLDGLSVRVDGTLDGAPFTFTSSLAATVVLPGRFEIGMDDMNLTLALDAASWFAPGGIVLDPRVEANRAAIEARIVASLALFGDHDRDGLEDALEGEGARGHG